MSIELQVREAAVADIEILREYEQGVVEAERPFNDTLRAGPATYYDLEALIESEDSALLVAENSAHIVATGYATIKASSAYLRHDRHSYLGFMYVRPEYRGQGIVQKMLDALVDWSRSKGVHDFYLDVYADNVAAISAYEKYGFKSNLIEMKINDERK